MQVQNYSSVYESNFTGAWTSLQDSKKPVIAAVNGYAVSQHVHVIMSPPFRVGRRFVFATVICLSQNRVHSVIWKPLKISSWNFI